MQMLILVCSEVPTKRNAAKLATFETITNDNIALKMLSLFLLRITQKL